MKSDVRERIRMNMVGTKLALAGIALLVVAIVSGCNSGTPGDPTATPGSVTTAPTGGPGATATLFGIRGEAKVDSLEITMSGSSTVQVQVVARGFLQDACTKIDSVNQKHNATTYVIVLGTYRAPNVMCAQVNTEYKQTIDLDVAGLKAGTYTVMAGGASKQFTLAANNP